MINIFYYRKAFFQLNKKEYNKKMREYSPIPISLFIPSDVWFDSLKHFESTSKHVNMGMDMKFQLEEGYILQTLFFNDLWYVSFLKYSNGRIVKNSGTNFNRDEWRELMKIKDIISTELSCKSLHEANKKKQSEVSSNAFTHITGYRWKYETHDGEVLETSETIFYSEEDCFTDGYNTLPGWVEERQDLVLIPPKVEICKEFIKLPDNHKVMERCFIVYVKDLLSKMGAKLCEGCKVDSPSQKDHLGGCLLEIEEKLEKYLSDVIVTINKDNLGLLFFETTKGLFNPHSDYKDLLSCVTNYIPLQHVNDIILSEYNSDDKISPLDLLIQRTYSKVIDEDKKEM